jgi:hypothetical protein
LVAAVAVQQPTTQMLVQVVLVGGCSLQYIYQLVLTAFKLDRVEEQAEMVVLLES